MVLDSSSFSNFDQVRPFQCDLDWYIDFEKKLISGSVGIDFNVIADTNHIILDGHELVLESVQHNDDSLAFEILEKDHLFGQEIIITTKETLKAGEKGSILIKYKTAVQPRALQFLSKEQTKDKKAEYLFSNCCTIHARSILPCMDTPSAKVAYTAKVSVPTGLVCLMSAISTGVSSGESRAVYSFSQKLPIPTYLIAIAVGCLEKRDISPRCAVWAEPSMVEACLWEFADTELFLKTAEDIAGPYLWERYDMIVLPPTFPYGGMENPNLTFITPTLLAGDRSLVGTVAHEIAHSWTGNLVTNANWEHFWLNEGFTRFLEDKIIGRTQGEQHRQFDCERSYEERLLTAIEKELKDTPELTKLVTCMKGVDPDDAVNTVPYEKGTSFLLYIEQAIGDAARFEEFLRSYFVRYARQSITTDEWKDQLFKFFEKDRHLLDKVDFDVWLHQPGMPPKPKFDYSLTEACKKLAEQWLSEQPPTDSEEFDKMSPAQKTAVLDFLRQTGKFDKIRELLPQLTALYKLLETKNVRVLYAYLMLSLESRWEPIIPPALRFCKEVGRIKQCKSVYKELFNWPIASAIAIQQFEENRKFMHPVTANAVAKLLQK